MWFVFSKRGIGFSIGPSLGKQGDHQDRQANGGDGDPDLKRYGE